MSSESPKILLADDEPDILELLKYNFENRGYTIYTAKNGKTALELAEKHNPELIILDIMMPEIDGIETCRLLRENSRFKNTYIIFLTARSEEYSEVAAFQNGADDYVTKPIKPRALLSRIDAYFRRTAKKGDTLLTDQINILDLTIDRPSYKITDVTNKDTILPKKEFELIYYLAKNSGRVFSRDELLSKIWGTYVEVTPRTVDVHIRKIREKLGDNYIKTVKGVGYKFNAE